MSLPSLYSLLPLLILFVLPLVHCDILPVSTTLHYGTPTFVRAAGMFAAQKNYDPVSYLKLTLDFSGSSSGSITSSPFVQVLVLHASDLSNIGMLGASHHDDAHNQVESYCCTKQYVDRALCPAESLNKIIVHPTHQHSIWELNVDLHVNTSTIPNTSILDGSVFGDKRGRYDILSDGEYILLLSHCNSDIAHVDISVSGIQEWYNSNTFLVGHYGQLYNFKFFSCIIYTLLLFVWLSLNILYYRDTTLLQIVLTLLIFAAFMSEAFQWIHLHHVHKSGVVNYTLLFISLTFSLLQQITWRLALYALCCGWQIVRPHLNSPLKITSILLVYSLLNGIYEYNVYYLNAFSDDTRKFYSGVIAVVNALIYWSSFISLQSLLMHFDERKQHAKTLLYYSLRRVLLAACIIAALIGVYRVHFIVSLAYLSEWSSIWVFDAAYTTLFFCVLTAIAVIFRPSNVATNFIYSAVAGDEDFDEDEMSEHFGGVNASGAMSNVLDQYERDVDDAELQQPKYDLGVEDDDDDMLVDADEE